MKKKTFALLLLLTALLALVGLLNRFWGKSSETAASSGAASEETSDVAAGSTGDEIAWLTRSCPEKSIEFNAICPTQTEATTLPLLTAQLNYDYYEQMAQELLLARYPESETVEEDAYDDTGWQLLSEDGTQLLASIDIFDYGLVVFNDSAQDITLHAEYDTSGDSASFYNPLDDTHSFMDEDETLSAADAIQIAVQAIQLYTDFDLSAYNVSLQTNTDGDSAYRIYLQLSYEGTPVALYSQVHMTQVDTEIRDNGVLGYLQGVFCFSNIREGESCSVMSMEDAVTAFTNQAGTLFDSTTETLTVYHLQREYTAQVGESGDFVFRPVWTFYYHTPISTVSGEQGLFYGIARLYADTGEICTDNGSYLAALRSEDGQ